ncbi:hypothetical protein [Natronorubrum sp. A-ect3]|uniref:hypothetical protein n=1 Tax=Natronorubrum sp. A-ect3 TaxID=3242698 RepID=UPI00359D0A9A
MNEAEELRIRPRTFPGRFDRKVLKAVAEDPAWKKEISRRVDSPKSGESVRRGVDKLARHGFLEAFTTRDHDLTHHGEMTMYRLTEKGREALKEHTQDTIGESQ